MRIIVIALGVVIIVLLGVLLFVQPTKNSNAPVQIHQVASSTDGSLIVLAPEMDAVIASPIAISGSAKGWYFEATFPIKIMDGDGMILGSGQARAQGDWMTTSSVPFLASISFTNPKYSTGTILFQKDNPSGLPQNDKELIVPIRFR